MIGKVYVLIRKHIRYLESTVFLVWRYSIMKRDFIFETGGIFFGPDTDQTMEKNNGID